MEGCQMKDVMTIIELAEEIGVSPATLKRWEKCLELDVPLNEQSIPVYDENLQEILRQISNLRKTGNSFEKIADVLKISSYKITGKQNLDVSKTIIPEQNNPKNVESTEIKVIRKVVFPRVNKDGKEDKTNPLPDIQTDQHIIIKPMDLPVFESGEKKEIIAEDMLLPIESKEVQDKEEQFIKEQIQAPEPIQPEITKEIIEENILTEQTDINTEKQDENTLIAEKTTENEMTESKTIESFKVDKESITESESHEQTQSFDQDLSVKESKSSAPQIIDYKEGKEIMSAYIQLTESYKTLAAKYSEATFKIGQLEERSRHLTLLLEQKQKEEKQLFLPLKEQVEGLNKKISDTQEGLKQQLTETQEDLNKKLTETKKEIQDVPQKEEQDDKSSAIEELEKQVRLLTVFILDQKQQKKGFWAKIKSFFSGKVI